jgi:leader peptidase (prepilin peptidase)/N-methyltransferase
MLVAFVSGTLVGIGIMARHGVRQGRKRGIPFGPFLAFGGVVALLVGPDLVEAYRDAFL